MGEVQVVNQWYEADLAQNTQSHVFASFTSTRRLTTAAPTSRPGAMTKSALVWRDASYAKALTDRLLKNACGACRKQRRPWPSLASVAVIRKG